MTLQPTGARSGRAAVAGLPRHERLLRAGYYLLFWYMPYRQFSTRARRGVRRFHVLVFALVGVVYAARGDALGAVMFLAAALLSHGSLGLIDDSIERGAPVPRTPYNLPADLEPPLARGAR